MTPLQAVFILTTFVVHVVTVTTFPLDEEDDGYESDAAQCDEEEEEERDEEWYEEWESSVEKSKFSNDDNKVIKKFKTC